MKKISESTIERLNRQVRELETQLADAEASYARAISERAYFRGQAKKWYERNRLLENRIREMHEKSSDAILRLALRPLVHRIPLKPRKKWGWRQHGG